MSDEERKALQERYDKVISEKFAPIVKTHTKREFTFTVPEKRRIIQQETIIFLANQAINDIIDFSVLPRLGMIRTAKISVFYDATLGRFTVFQPKEEKSNTEQQPSESSQETT